MTDDTSTVDKLKKLQRTKPIPAVGTTDGELKASILIKDALVLVVGFEEPAMNVTSVQVNKSVFLILNTFFAEVLYAVNPEMLIYEGKVADPTPKLESIC